MSKKSVLDKLKDHKKAIEASQKSRRFFSDWPKDVLQMAEDAISAVRSGEVSLSCSEVARFIVNEAKASGKLKKLPAVDTVSKWVSKSLNGI